MTRLAEVHMRKATVGLVSAILLTSMIGCSLPHRGPPIRPMPYITDTLPVYTQKTTLAQASENLTFGIPFPHYLPDNENVQEVFKEDDSVVGFIVSDETVYKQIKTRTTPNGKTFQEYEFRCTLTIRIQWLKDGIEPMFIIPGIQPKMTPVQGIIHLPTIFERGSTKILEYYWNPKSDETPAYNIVITASNRTPNEELVRIAESIW